MSPFLNEGGFASFPSFQNKFSKYSAYVSFKCKSFLFNLEVIPEKKPIHSLQDRPLWFVVEKKRSGSNCPNRKGIKKSLCSVSRALISVSMMSYKFHFTSPLLLKHHTMIEVSAKFSNDNFFFLPTHQPSWRDFSM